MRGLLVLVCCSATACAFDLSWIPADGEGPLPLSTSYRQQLARLCDIIESGSVLPPSIAERRSDIEKMCAKLRVAERPRGFLRVGATLAGVALGGGYAWRNYESKGWLYKGRPGRTTAPAPREALPEPLGEDRAVAAGRPLRPVAGDERTSARYLAKTSDGFQRATSPKSAGVASEARRSFWRRAATASIFSRTRRTLPPLILMISSSV